MLHERQQSALKEHNTLLSGTLSSHFRNTKPKILCDSL